MVVDHTMVVVYRSFLLYCDRAAGSCERYVCHYGHALPQRNVQSRESFWKTLSAKTQMSQR